MKIVTSFKIITAFVFILGLASCGGGSSSSGDSDNLIGTWSGNAQSAITGRGFSLTLRVTSDTGSNWAGTLSSPDSDIECGREFSISGTRTGNDITAGGAINNQGVIAFEAVLSGNRIAGNYRVTSGACAGDRGTWEVTR